MSKNRTISGFPEWLPNERMYEEQQTTKLRQLAQSFGFVPIETSAVELIETLCSKGVVDKELFAIKRLAATEQEETELGLHFDLTVPLARYVVQNLQNLTFPFKRYQIQKVWRGERPQKGRFREFYQCDFDIIGRDDLPLACDVEILTLIDVGFLALNVAKHSIRLGSRKLLLGYYQSLGLDDAKCVEVIRVVDKLQKIGADRVKQELVEALAISTTQADAILYFAGIKSPLSAASKTLRELKLDSATFANASFAAGIVEVEQLIALIADNTAQRIELDLSLARGLDYYTGLIFEVFFPDFPEYGSVGAGGRYENLAANFGNQKLPGVGGTIGLTRVIDCALKQQLAKDTPASVSKVLVTLYNEQQGPQAFRMAEELRSLGVPCEVYFKPVKLGKQIEYANAKSIRYVIFLSEEGNQIKDLQTKEQQVLGDLKSWLDSCRS